MRIPSLYEINTFLLPLRGKTTAFMIDGRQTNIHLARFILNSLLKLKAEALIIDINAFYSSNILSLIEMQMNDQAGNILIRMPKNDSDVEALLTDSLFGKYEFLVIDDLNTVHHLLSSEGQKSGNKRLYLISHVLSYVTLTNKTFAFLTFYSSGPNRQGVGAKSLARLSDTLVSVEIKNSLVTFRCNRGKAWTDNTFSLRI